MMNPISSLIERWPQEKRDALKQLLPKDAWEQLLLELERDSPPGIMRKANQALQNKIKDNEHQKIRVILFLEPLPASHKRLNPRDFPSSIEWRKALIEQQRQSVEDGYKETMTFLEELDLSPHGAALGATTVEGYPENILVALAWPVIKGAILDENISLKKTPGSAVH